MKLKTILIFAFAALFAVGVISCEDILKVESKTVMYDTDHQFDQATDTVYTVLGIIKQMQKIADRSVILGEVRGDLVDVTDHATDDIRDLYDYDFKNLKTNKYDKALDYYAIINNCNYFLNNVDLEYKKDGEYVFRKEYIVVLSYRAWAYLQLAQAYGKVPFFDKPITGDISWNSDDKLDIKQLAKILVADFKDEYMDYDLPNYGDLQGEAAGEGASAVSHKSKELFIPVRLIMGDLYLWAEDYPHAALCYYGFLTDLKKQYPVGDACLLWTTNDFLYGPSSSYLNLFTDGSYLCYIPMEVDEYNGVVSDLPNIFNSTKDNKYWYQLTSSQAAQAISIRQKYCYHGLFSATNQIETAYYMNKKEEGTRLLRGDLRLQAVLTKSTKDLKPEELNVGGYSTSRQELNKINSEKIWLYRKDVVYLRLAEALNRCGLPETAFAILKTGLCEENIDSLLLKDNFRAEKEKSANIFGVDISTVYDFKRQYFTRATAIWTTQNMNDGGAASTNYQVFAWGPRNNVGNTYGIHSRGCGDASFDSLYTIGNKLSDMAAAGELVGVANVDSMRAVEEFLIDEMALETCFEGYRFGDLMRIAMHRAQDYDNPDFAENRFLAKRVANRRAANEDDTKDYFTIKAGDALYDKLNGNGHSFNKDWFLYLPDEK